MRSLVETEKSERRPEWMTWPWRERPSWGREEVVHCRRRVAQISAYDLKSMGVGEMRSNDLFLVKECMRNKRLLGGFPITSSIVSHFRLPAPKYYIFGG